MTFGDHKMAYRSEKCESGRYCDTWNAGFFSSHGNLIILGWFVGLRHSNSGSFPRKNADAGDR